MVNFQYAYLKIKGILSRLLTIMQMPEMALYQRFEATFSESEKTVIFSGKIH